MISTDQTINDTMPNTFCGETFTGCGSDGLNTVCTVYNGLVPMSPNTTPSAPTDSASRPAPCLIALPAFPVCVPLGGPPWGPGEQRGVPSPGSRTNGRTPGRVTPGR